MSLLSLGFYIGYRRRRSCFGNFRFRGGCFFFLRMRVKGLGVGNVIIIFRFFCFEERYREVSWLGSL